MKKIFIIIILIFIIPISIGVYKGLKSNVDDFLLLNLSDLLSFFATILIGSYIYFFFSSYLNKKIKKREVILEIIHEILEALYEARKCYSDLFKTHDLNYQAKIAYSIKNMFSKLDLLKSFIKEKKIQELPDLDKLTKLILEFKMLVTGTKVYDEIKSFRMEIKSEIDYEYELIQKSIFSLKIEACNL